MATVPVPPVFPTSFIPPTSLSATTVHPPPLTKNPSSAPNPSPPDAPLSDQPPPPPLQFPTPSPTSGAAPAASSLLPGPISAPDLDLLPGPSRGPTAQPTVPPSPHIHLPTPPPPPPYTQTLPPNTLPHPRHQRTSPSSDPIGPPAHPQQLSYAQVVRSSRDPSFVRAHASAVESFANIPRTGVNIICGSKEGMPSFSFVSADLPRVEEIYSNALVMKFIGGRPSLEASHKEILSWGMENQFSIGPLSSRAFLL